MQHLQARVAGEWAVDPAALLLEGEPLALRLPGVLALGLEKHPPREWSPPAHRFQHAVPHRLIAARRILHKIFLLLAELHHIARTVILHPLKSNIAGDAITVAMASSLANTVGADSMSGW